MYVYLDMNKHNIYVCWTVAKVLARSHLTGNVSSEYQVSVSWTFSLSLTLNKFEENTTCNPTSTFVIFGTHRQTHNELYELHLFFAPYSTVIKADYQYNPRNIAR